MKVRTDGTKNVVHLKNHHGKIGRAVNGLQCLICEKEVVEWKIICHLQGHGDAFGLYQE